MFVLSTGNLYSEFLVVIKDLILKQQILGTFPNQLLRVEGGSGRAEINKEGRVSQGAWGYMRIKIHINENYIRLI